jgi:hypothetical protein
MEVAGSGWQWLAVANSGWQWLAVAKGTAYNNAAFILHRKKFIG